MPAVMLKRARDSLEEAQKALASGKEAQEGDLDWVGKAKGGARPVPTEAYGERMKALEEAVKSAEREVDRAERAKRAADID